MKTNARILVLSAFAASLLNLTPNLLAQVATNLAPAYRIVDIGILPSGPDDSYAVAVNNAGQVIGNCYVAAPSYYKGFIWDPVNGMRDLGFLPGKNMTEATGINNQGVVVGYSGDGYWGWFQAYRWDSINGLQDLGFGAIAGYPYYGANSINDGGAIGYANWNYNGAPSKAYLLIGTTATWIGELYPNGYTFPSGLNNNNEVVGPCWSCTYCSDGVGQAFHWKSDQGMVGLGFLPGYTNSIANAINDASQAVGYCYNSDGTQAAFIWTSGSGMTQLGLSLVGESNSCANAISAGGIAVGYSQIGGTDQAVAWAPGQNAVALNTLVTNLNVDGWTNITEANGINSYGIIVGDGLKTNGVRHAFVLYPANGSSTPATVGIKMFAGVIIKTGQLGANYLIQATPNLGSGYWTTLTNVALPSLPYIYIDYNSPTNAQQFYQAVPQ